MTRRTRTRSMSLSRRCASMQTRRPTTRSQPCVPADPICRSGGVPEPAAEVAREGVAAGLGVARTLPGELGARLADEVIHAFTHGTSWAFGVSAVLASVAAVAIGSRIPNELPGGHGPPPTAPEPDVSASTSTSPATPA